MRRGAVLGWAVLVLSVTLHAQELPQSDDSLEIEPPLLVPPESSEPTVVNSEPATPPNVEKLESDLARSRKRAAAGERLFRAGIIAKVDAEKRALRVVQLEAELAQARVDEAKKNPGAQDDAALAQLVAAARQADEERQRAEFEAAALNVKRQRMLLALGSGRKSDVARAEEKLASLAKPSP